jgi:hypothetical protein
LKKLLYFEKGTKESCAVMGRKKSDTPKFILGVSGLTAQTLEALKTKATSNSRSVAAEARVALESHLGITEVQQCSQPN